MGTQPLSYLTTPLRHAPIGVCFHNAAARSPDHEAFVGCDQGARFTFAENEAPVDYVAADRFRTKQILFYMLLEHFTTNLYIQLIGPMDFLCLSDLRIRTVRAL
jgi:hypothetical protein